MSFPPDLLSVTLRDLWEIEVVLASRPEDLDIDEVVAFAEALVRVYCPDRSVTTFDLPWVVSAPGRDTYLVSGNRP